MPNSEGEQEKVGAWLGLLNLEIDMSAGMGGGAPLAIPAEETLKRAYKQRARELHPDKKAPEEREYYADQFKKMKNGFDELMKRREGGSGV